MTVARYDLSGKVVLITGGNGGIGHATAREVLRRGGRVAVLDLDPATPELAEQLHPSNAIGVLADVCDRSALERAVDATVERFGRVDVAIANAGVLSRAATLRAMPAAEVDKVLAVNVTGVINTVTATMDQLIVNRGHVVLISSVFAFLNGMGTIPYAMSKAAVEQLGRGLRVELADHGVSTTVAYFSLIDTDMIRRGVDADPDATELVTALPRPLLKRLRPEDAANAIADGIERRSARVIQPSRWAPLSALRGVLGPALDARLARDRRTLDVLAKLDAR